METYQTKNLDKRRLFLTGTVDTDMSDEFREQILYLMDKDKKEAITIHINSGGGSVVEMFAIHDLIQRAKRVAS
jgi:ATP-dependent protease ClpP protease subunit